MVNSAYDDYAPTLIDSTTLILTSARPDWADIGLRDALQGPRVAALYFSMRLDRTWDEAARYRLFLDDDKEVSGTISYAPAGSPYGAVAYLGTCNRDDSSVTACDLFALVTGAGAGLVNLGSPLNTSSWEGMPFVTADGARLYFASDRPGGMGGTDIWYCARTDAGTWGTPVNAGPTINTAGDELSPFVDQASGATYFAASERGAPFDIYMWEDGLSTRQPLTAPYNSSADDFTPFVFGDQLYLASNRDGGCGGFDLYAFPRPR